jgi:hypothetical protein
MLSHPQAGKSHTISLIGQRFGSREIGSWVFWQTKDNVGIGTKAPDFTLPSQSGEMVNLTDLFDRKPVVMVFQHYKEQIP